MSTGVGAPRQKQHASHESWVAALETVWTRLTAEHVERRLQEAAGRVRSLPGRVAYAWSGGKESIVLEAVCNQARVEECILAICDLEFPEFLSWATDHMPPGLTVVNTGHDLHWLAAHPEMLFPSTAALAARWFRTVQHAGQRGYFRKQSLDWLLLGRRRGDGNYVGKPGEWSYRDRHGVVRASPLHDWTNDEVLGAIRLLDLPLAPCYRWPRGFHVGTGPWPARQWLPTVTAGWEEIHAIDPTVVAEAAAVIASARDFLDGAR